MLSLFRNVASEGKVCCNLGWNDVHKGFPPSFIMMELVPVYNSVKCNILWLNLAALIHKEFKSTTYGVGCYSQGTQAKQLLYSTRHRCTAAGRPAATQKRTRPSYAYTYRSRVRCV
ncbi:hypothetical protein NPIL_506971 [Nephila pilipes]|uniref:Uncharacterized protein n=1 Tax=Nephila pilipes TaxID=299642 RepID=A0A8X6QS63_NEPPI|nr:hypothetical protein NPIL_506971 [Nephila pilipes]